MPADPTLERVESGFPHPPRRISISTRISEGINVSSLVPTTLVTLEGRQVSGLGVGKVIKLL